MTKLLKIFIIAIVLGPILSTPSLADQLPVAKDVDKLSMASAGTFDAFITETFLPRAQLEYAGRLTDPADSEIIVTHAKTSVETLTSLFNLQQQISRRIDEYDDADWDERYGNNSLWRDSVTAARQTRWRICIVNYHHGLALTGEKKEKLLKKVLDQTGKDFGFSTHERNLLRAQSEWALAPEKNIDITIRRLDSLIASSGMDNEVFYQAVIMRMKLTARINAPQINALAGSLKKSKLKNNFELLFKLALEELKAGGEKLINEISGKHPAAAIIAGEIILRDIASNADNEQLLSITLKTKTPVEVQLAAVTAAKEQSDKYSEIFEEIIKIEKFQSDAVYLAAAVSCRQREPAKSVAYYMKSAKKARLNKSDSLELSAAEIARQGGRLAYDLYYKDSTYFATAKEAISVYMDIAGKNTDEELTYLYASMLIDSGKNETAIGILNNISAGSGKYANAASFDIIFYAAKKTKPHSTHRKELIITLKNFIDKQTAKKDDLLNTKEQAIELYCKLLLEEGGKGNGATVLEVLENMPYRHTPEIAVIKAAALAETGDLVKAAETLVKAVEKGKPKGAALLAVALTAEILEDIDEYEDKVEDFGDFTIICYNLADYAAGSAENQGRTEGHKKVHLELSIIKARKDTETMNVAKYLLEDHAKRNEDDIDWLRCRARLDMKQGRFAEAFEAWSSIAQTRKMVSRSSVKSAKWWRAKYYALKCYSKISDKNNNELTRAIEILLNTNKNIPPFWGKKLLVLKETIGDQ